MNEITLHVFDMDHTLINNDCDVSWKTFMVKEKLAPADALETASRFYQDYEAGGLDSKAFMQFQLAEFVGKNPEEMRRLTHKHFDNYVKSKIYRSALDYVRNLQVKQIPCALLTSTNLEIANPLADFFFFDYRLGTILEKQDDLFTGAIQEPYGASEGKVTILSDFAAKNGFDLQSIAYYGDSINDRFVLDAVGKAYAVNPDDALKKLAEEKGWTILDWTIEGIMQ